MTDQNETLTGLTKKLIRESEALARAEAALVKSEINEKIAEAEKGTAALMAGGATLTAGLLILLFAAVFALDQVMDLWQAALLVGGAVTVLGLIMVSTGKQKMTADNLTPKRTLEEISRGTRLAKEQAR